MRSYGYSPSPRDYPGVTPGEPHESDEGLDCDRPKRGLSVPVHPLRQRNWASEGCLRSLLVLGQVRLSRTANFSAMAIRVDEVYGDTACVICWLPSACGLPKSRKDAYRIGGEWPVPIAGRCREHLSMAQGKPTRAHEYGEHTFRFDGGETTGYEAELSG